MAIHKFQDAAVEEKFARYPQAVKAKLLFVRELIFEVAAEHEEIGGLEETLKWGEPSYLTPQSKSGSTIRIDWKAASPDNYFIYFHCKTTLISEFKERYGALFTYGGNRCLIFSMNDQLPVEAVKQCIAMALMYHRHKK